jgi:hypothetical protein
MAQRLIQAYQQAPWRIQIQRLRTVLLLILVFALVTSVYLFISAQAAMAGLNIQDGEFYREKLQREIASLKTQLGNVNSIATMEERALKAGYKPAPTDKGMYVIVTGYFGKPQVNLAPPPGPDLIPENKIKPEYTTSLSEWLFRMSTELKPVSGGK